MTGAIVGLLALTTIAIGGSLYKLSGKPSFGPRVPMRILNQGYRTPAVPRAIRYLREHTKPGDAIFVARAEPLIYFATDTRNPTPYGGVIPGLEDEQQRVILEALETTPYVVMTDIDQPVFTYYRDELPSVQAYLERHFRIPADFLGPYLNWMLVLERGPDRGSTHTDLLDIETLGRRWVRRGDGSLSFGHVVDDKVGSIQNRRLLTTVLGRNGGGIDFDLSIPPDAVFQSSVGYPTATGYARVYTQPLNSLMMLSVKTEDGFRVLSEKRVLKRAPTPRTIVRWEPFEVDLAEFAGRDVTLRLSLKPKRPLRQTLLAWWGSPRIAIRANSDVDAGASASANANADADRAESP